MWMLQFSPGAKCSDWTLNWSFLNSGNGNMFYSFLAICSLSLLFFFLRERAILKILYNVGCAKVKLFETSYKYSKMQRFESVCLQNEVETEYAALYWKTPFEKRKIVFDREYFVAIFIYFYIYLILWLFISLKWQQCFGYAVYKNKLKYLNIYFIIVNVNTLMTV